MRLIEQPSELKFAYEDGADVADALEAVATKVYRADGVDFTPAAKRQLAELRENGLWQPAGVRRQDAVQL